MSSLKNILGQNAFWMVNKSIALEVGVEAALLLSLLIDLDNGDWFDCQRDYITEKTGMKRRSITTAISKLEEAGFVEKRVSGIPPKTQFLMCTNQIVQNVQIKTYKTYESNGTKRTNILINKKEVIKKENKKRGSAGLNEVQKGELADLFAWLGQEGLTDVWSEWEQHRKEKRSKLTPSTQLKQLKKIKELGTARARAALSHSIEQGYTGIYEPRTTNDKPANTFTSEGFNRIINKDSQDFKTGV